jgi:hypothetical protein
MITLLKSNMDPLLKNRRVDVISEKYVQRFNYCLLALCIGLYISVFATSTEMPLGDINIENKNIRSIEYFENIPVTKGSAYGFFEEKEDVVLVPVGE